MSSIGEVGADAVDELRAFNRRWTELIGVLDAGYLETPFSLTEARVLFELARAADVEQVDLRVSLGIDASYLSRILRRFRRQGLVVSHPSPDDGRRVLLALTEQGRAAFADLDHRSAEQVRRTLESFTPDQRARLVRSLRAARAVVDPPERPRAWVLRSVRPGDLGWVVQRHGALYAAEYGWDQAFEGLVARIVAEYVDTAGEGRRQHAWIAELDGEPVGSVFCVERDPSTAQLRLLLVESSARGLGIGARLVEECLRFAADQGFERMMLWTNDVLVAARRIYEAAGFELVEEEPHHSFGRDLVGQVWARDLP